MPLSRWKQRRLFCPILENPRFIKSCRSCRINFPWRFAPRSKNTVSSKTPESSRGGHKRGQEILESLGDPDPSSEFWNLGGDFFYTSRTEQGLFTAFD